MQLLINILFIIWTAPLYRVPYNIGSGYSAIFRPHGTVGLPLLTIPGGTKLLINLLPTSQKKKKSWEGKKKGREEKNQVWPKKYKGYVCIPNYMGACFQAPRAAPGQRLMETYIGKCVWATQIPLQY